jgi:hypothetical protein
MAGILNLNLNNPLRQFDPLNQIGNQPQDQPFSPFKVPKLRINPLNPPETEGDVDESSIDTSPVFKSSLSQFRNLDTPDRNTYREFLKSGMPERSEHQLTKMGKALSLISGAAEGYHSGAARGTAHGLGLMERPYQQALENYSNKGGMLKELAGLEYQDTADRKSLEVEINKDQLAQQNAYYDALKTRSGLKLDEARMKDISSEIANRGLSLERNKADGQLYVVNRVKGTKQSLGQFDNTMREEEALKHEYWTKRYDKEQDGRFALQNDAQGHALMMQGRGFDHDKVMADYRDKLDRMKPENVNKAWSAAYDRVLTENPDLREQLFITDEKGNLVLKTKENSKGSMWGGAEGQDYNPEVYSQFIKAVNQRTNKDLGLPDVSADSFSKYENTDPKVTQAIASMKDWNKNHPNDPIDINSQTIQNAIEDADKELPKGVDAKGQPQVNLNMPTPQLGPMIGRQAAINPRMAPGGGEQPSYGPTLPSAINPRMAGMAMQEPPSNVPQQGLIGNPYSLSNVGNYNYTPPPTPSPVPQQPIQPPPVASQPAMAAPDFGPILPPSINPRMAGNPAIQPAMPEPGIGNPATQSVTVYHGREAITVPARSLDNWIAQGWTLEPTRLPKGSTTSWEPAPKPKPAISQPKPSHRSHGVTTGW